MMIKLKTIKRFLFSGILVMLMFSELCSAQEIRLTKSIDRTFNVAAGVSLDVTNKYGNIVVNTWDENKIQVKIEITAFGKDEDDAEHIMDRVEFDFHQSGNFLTIESVFDRNSSFIKELFNSIGDYSKTILSKSKLMVNYDVSIPVNAGSIKLDNKFGDVFLNEFAGRSFITLSHGNLKANELSGFSELNLNYGDAHIKSLADTKMDLKGMDIEVDEINNGDVNCGSSEITVGSIDNLTLSSTNDKIQIDEIAQLTGNANFSEIRIHKLLNSCKISQNYGELEIAYIEPNFDNITFYGKSTDYNIHIGKPSNFSVDLTAKEENLRATGLIKNLQKQYIDEKNKFVRYTGKIGSTTNVQRLLFMDAMNGEVDINLVNQSIETMNK